jgi:hypothetical protein
VRDNGKLVLQPFGRIEGAFKRGAQPVTAQEFTLVARGSNLSFDWTEYKAATDANGRFVFDRVPPGEIQIVRLVSTGEQSWTHSYGADVAVAPGQTAQVTIGDSGATLTGRIRFESPPAEAEKLSIEGRLSTVLPPLPASLSAEEKITYYQSAEGSARVSQMKHFVINIAADSSWSVDSIPPGSYRFNVTASKPGARPWESSPVATATAEVVVPEGATPQTQIGVEDLVLRTNADRGGQAAPLQFK